VRFQVMPGRVFGMLGRVNGMGMGYVGVMGGRVVVAGLMMLRRLSMVVGSHAVMMGCLFVVIRCLL
jgi:hypothetical protein